MIIDSTRAVVSRRSVADIEESQRGRPSGSTDL